MGGRLGKYFVRQPNLGFLRSRGLRLALGVPVQPITSADLRAAGLGDLWVKWLAREEHICASNAAVYIYCGRITDRLERMARKHPAMTVGLTTALWLGNVLAERPAVDHWMIDEAKRRPIWLPPDVLVHRSRHAMDETFDAVMGGVTIRAHRPLRALLDCVRFREELGHDAVRRAIKGVLASGAVDLPGLLARARLTKVRTPLLRFLAELSVEASVAARDDLAPTPTSSPSPAAP